MARPALFSYEGALRVLGEYDHPWLDKADVFLGVSILASGAAEPSLLSLVDPKNEATGALRKILDGVTAKLTGLKGVHRHELVAAAHTIIAVTAVFDALRVEIGPSIDELKITDREKFRVFGAEPGKRKEVSALPGLTALDVPAPNATRGFQENLSGELSQFFSQAAALVIRFVDGLGVESKAISADTIVVVMRERYQHYYLGLAATIPEFLIWTLLGEHAATRAIIQQNDANFLEALTSVQTQSLELFSRLISQLSSGELSSKRSYRKKLANVGGAVLSKPLLRGSTVDSAIAVAFPTIELGFVTPAYRLGVYHDEMQPSSRAWWAMNTEVRDDIDTFLAAHLCGHASTTLPLLILGDPGAGKSLLMDVLAARLPADRFTVVTVQLRKVRAADPVYMQIETALSEIFSERVGWGRLADECDDSIPVILLDGFDELIQASGVHQSTYIQQIREFQENQADVGRPVVVLITSRMLVADRARIPLGTPILKLEEFDGPRVKQWLEKWNNANIDTPGFRPLKQDQLDSHVDLAGQPLLLLMLAIYAADSDNPPLDDRNLSNAELYGRLIESFVLRQVRHKGRVPLAEDHIKWRARESRWQLGIAALAMFNRGRQFVNGEELNQDLAIFAAAEEPSLAISLDAPVSTTDRTLENFFFIHSPTLNQGSEGVRRSYEFLHATFGEYLVAEVTITLLQQLVVARTVPTGNPYHRTVLPDDSLFRALVSHQVFTKRKTVLEFATGLFAALDDDTRAGIIALLNDLSKSVHERTQKDSYPTYIPTKGTLVSRIATYSANLVCLRIFLGGVASVESLVSQGEYELDYWRSTVHLWHAGLDVAGWQSLVETLTIVEIDTSWMITLRDDDELSQIMESQLLGDGYQEGALQAGTLFADFELTSDSGDQKLLRELVAWIASTSGSGGRKHAIPYDVRVLTKILDQLDGGMRLSGLARDRMTSAMSREAWRLPRDVVERSLRHLVPETPEECDTLGVNNFELISIVCSHPDLIKSGVFPQHLLPRLFEAAPSSAMAAAVLTWSTVASGGSGADDAFRVFSDEVYKTALPYLSSVSDVYLPVEIFEYLAQHDSITTPFDEGLLEVLTTSVQFIPNAISARAFTSVVERFLEAGVDVRPDDEKILEFIVAYLMKVGLSPRSSDLASALELLRRFADQSSDGR